MKLVEAEAREDGSSLKYLSGNIPNGTPIPKGSHQFQAHISSVEILVKMGPIKCWVRESFLFHSAACNAAY